MWLFVSIVVLGGIGSVIAFIVYDSSNGYKTSVRNTGTGCVVGVIGTLLVLAILLAAYRVGLAA
jgi:hypothetical protein